MYPSCPTSWEERQTTTHSAASEAPRELQPLEQRTSLRAESRRELKGSRLLRSVVERKVRTIRSQRLEGGVPCASRVLLLPLLSKSRSKSNPWKPVAAREVFPAPPARYPAQRQRGCS
ncbi:hypothetical protein RTBOTA2_006441 [Rhodotorula toruloides]|nr:hypothetical protein RTBOTA2_006441 [Rhodotorula toruloides]